MLTDEVRELAHSSEWHEQSIDSRGSGIFYVDLRTKNINTKHDGILWNITMNEAQELGLLERLL